MARLSVFCLLAAVLLVCCLRMTEAGPFGDCPPSSQHTRCENRCLQNHECASMGGKCCPNLCNYSSCVIPKPGNSGVSGYKGSASNSAYCGNVKCSPFEKCGTDSNKRPKCVRA